MRHSESFCDSFKCLKRWMLCSLFNICLPVIVAISFVWCLHEHSINMKLIDPVLLLYCNPFARLNLQFSGAMFLSISLILNNHTALDLHIICTIIRWLQWVCTFPGVLDWDYLITVTDNWKAPLNPNRCKIPPYIRDWSTTLYISPISRQT